MVFLNYSEAADDDNGDDDALMMVMMTMMMMMVMMTMIVMMLPGLDVLAVVHEQPQPPCQLAALPPGQQRQPQRDDGGVHGRVLRVGGQAGAQVRGTPGTGGGYFH